ncbi:MAG TPA: hypothetical protein VK791_06380 [bacterium]|jgi:hypothetical protein|nr:hypothetical protein [bacterium]
MSENICLECGTEMPYDWAPCPECGWKAPEPWEMDEESSPSKPASSGLLSKPKPWISWTVWILLGVMCLGLAVTLWRHF